MGAAPALKCALGVSSLVCLLNNGNLGTTETTQSLLGPFWRMRSPKTENGGSLVRSDTPGSPMFVNLAFRDQDGRAVEDALARDPPRERAEGEAHHRVPGGDKSVRETLHRPDVGHPVR